MAVKDLIVLNETDSKLEAQQGTDTTRIKGTANVLLDVVNESDVSTLKVDSSGSRVVFGGPVTMSGDFSGSLPSASFGRLEATVFSGSGRDITGVEPAGTISSSLQLSGVISGSWQNELSSSDLVFVDGGISASFNSSSAPGTRGVIGGGQTPGYTDTIGHFSMVSFGNAVDFGNLQSAKSPRASFSNGVGNRGLFASNVDANTNVIDAITINTAGNAADFGDANVARSQAGATSNGPNQRGLIAGGEPGPNNSIEFITISTLGNGADFGDLTRSPKRHQGLSNGTNERGVFVGGSVDNTIDFVTISSTGNATNFGDVAYGSITADIAADSNDLNERGFYAGGLTPGKTNTIEFITINSAGNGTDFGDLAATGYQMAATSNGINSRGVIGGGRRTPSSTYRATIEAISVGTTGNAFVFGSHTETAADSGIVSDGSVPSTANASSFGRVVAADVITGDGSTLSNVPFGGAVSESRQISDDVSGSFLQLLSGSNTPGVVFVGGGISSSMSPIPGQRGIIGGNNAIEYMNISALGQTALDFGDTILAANYGSWLSNGQNQRAVLAGDKPGNNTMQFITISTTGNSQDFGDLNTAFDSGTGISNGVADRGLFWGGGYGAAVNTIDFITISTTGNASDFGDGAYVRERHGGDSNGVGDRGVVIGGRPQVAPGGADSHGVNEVVNIKTAGNGTAFGTHGWNNYQGTFVKTATNDTNGRIVYQGMYYATQYFLSPTHNGNVSSFGSGLGGTGGADDRSFIGFSNGRDERGVFSDFGKSGGGYNGDALKFVTISTLGDAAAFGTLDVAADTQTVAATSDGYAGAVVTSSFYAMTGSFQGDASSVTGISIPANLVSSSGQFADVISGSFLNAFKSGSFMQLGGGISSSAALSSSFDDIVNQRGVFAGGGPGTTNTIDHVTISTRGDAQDFGDLTRPGRFNASTSNGVHDRGITHGGYGPGPGLSATIDFITISIPGNAADFGDATVERSFASAAVSNAVNNRGVFMGGNNPANKITMDYVTISSTGNAADFGDLTDTGQSQADAFSNATNDRGVRTGGRNNAPGGAADVDIMDFITITSTGNATDFGNLVAANRIMASLSNAQNERGIIAGGYTNDPTDVMQFITISTTGNATDFGDMPDKATQDGPGGSSNAQNERGIISGQLNSLIKHEINSSANTIYYITVSSLGGAFDFGDFQTSLRGSNTVGHQGNSNAASYPIIESSFSSISASRFVGDGSNITYYLPTGLLSSSRAGQIDLTSVTGSLKSSLRSSDLMGWWRMGDGASFGLSGSGVTNIVIPNDSVASRQASGSGEDVVTLYDVSGHGNHMTSSVPGRAGTQILGSFGESGSATLVSPHFNPSGSYGYVNEHALYLSQSYFTVRPDNFGAHNDTLYSPEATSVAWIRAADTTDQWRPVVSRYRGESTYRSYGLYQYGDALRLIMDRDGNNDDYIKTADEVLTVNQWHQIGFTHGFNSGSFMETKIYLDGVEQATTVGSGKMPSGSILNVPANFSIGNAHLSTATTNFWGDVDEVMLFGRALTADEMSTLYNSGTGSAPNLIGYQPGRNEMSASVLSNQLFVSGGLKTGHGHGNHITASTGGDRAVFGGGGPGSATNVIDFVAISTPGDAVNFGDMTDDLRNRSALSSGAAQRGVFGGGNGGPPGTDMIDFITIDTTGNAADFGNLTGGGVGFFAVSNGPHDRGVFGGGDPGGDNIDFITISSAGNATVWGALTISSNNRYAGGTSNGTDERAIYVGGVPAHNSIEFLTLTSTANVTDFGDATGNVQHAGVTSNGRNQRALFAGGTGPGSATNTIEYITINVASNALDFGDLADMTDVSNERHDAASNGLNNRGIINKPKDTAGHNEAINLGSLGNAVFFGSLSIVARTASAATDNAIANPQVASSFSRLTADRFSGIGTGITNINPSGLITSSEQLKEDISGSVGRFESTFSPYSVEMKPIMTISQSRLPSTGSLAYKNEKSLKLTGASNDGIYITGSIMAPISSSQMFSYFTWVRSSRTAAEFGQDQPFMEWYQDGDHNAIFRIRGHDPLMRVEGAGTTVSFDKTDWAAPEQWGHHWHHVGLTYEQSSSHVVDAVSGSKPHIYRVFLDGNVTHTASTAQELNTGAIGHRAGDIGSDEYNSTGPIRIGQRGPNGATWFGYINKSSFWATALSESAVHHLYNGGNPVDELSSYGTYQSSNTLVAHYRFGDTQEGVSASFDGSAWHFGNLASGSGNGYINTWASASAHSVASNAIRYEAPPTQDRVLTAPYPPALSGSHNATIAIWAKVGTTGKKSEYLIGDAARQGFEIRKGGDQNFHFAVLTGSSANATASFSTDHAIPDNNTEGTSSGFAHYALTFNGGGPITGYVQGSGSEFRTGHNTASLNFNTGSYKEPNHAGTGVLRFGKLTDESGSAWLGSIHEIAIWSTCLSASAITDLAAGPFDIASKITSNYNHTASLVSYWTMTSGSNTGGS